MLVLLNRAGHVLAATQVNPGLPRCDLIGQPLWMLAAPLYRDTVRQKLCEALESDAPQSCVVQTAFNLDRWSMTIQPELHLAGDVKLLATLQLIAVAAFDLTPKQRHILRLMASGRSVGQVAREMEVTENTIRTQLFRARKVVEADDLSVMILWAKENLLNVG
jgi:DNA-binding NarL/FixJ family response regulator